MEVPSHGGLSNTHLSSPSGCRWPRRGVEVGRVRLAERTIINFHERRAARAAPSRRVWEAGIFWHYLPVEVSRRPDLRDVPASHFNAHT